MSRLNGYILPIELIQAILLLLDIDSFHFASLTCGLWRGLALSAHVLRQQLKAVPAEVLPRSVLNNTTTAPQLGSLFRDVCRKNLIGVRSRISTSRQSTKSTAPQYPRIGDIRVRSHGQGHQFARLQGMTLTLCGVSETAKSREIRLSPTIYPSQDTVPQMWSHNYSQRLFGLRESARFQAAVSRCGELLAVGLGQKIHVYLLQSQTGRVAQVRYAEAEISESFLDSIQGLEFTDNDGFLRVEVSGMEGGYVKYLGRPRGGASTVRRDMYWMRTYTSGFDKVRHWKNALSEVYMDSRRIEESFRGGLGLSISLRGMRLMSTPSTQFGVVEDQDQGEKCKWFFALLREGPCDNRYVVGTISTDESVQIIHQIPTRQTGTMYSLEEKTPVLVDSGQRVDRWDSSNLPTAHCHDPSLAVSGDGRILAIFEPPHGHVQGALYIRSTQSLYSEIDCDGRVTSLPLLLSSPEHDLDSLSISLDTAERVYVVSAQLGQQTVRWSVERDWSV